jgi:hypothetical protein
MSTPTDLSSAILSVIQGGAQPVATKLNMPNMFVVDEGSLGDFPWFWQNGTNFNAKTFTWLNNVFAYNATDNYLGSNLQNFLTEYFNVLMDTSYSLSASDATALNNANLANAAVINTIITDWTTSQGAFPAGTNTQSAQLNYIMTQVISWGTAGLTLGTLRASVNPMSLLPNIPLGASQIVSDLMTYLGNTSSVANIQAAVVSANNQLAQTRANVAPAPTTLINNGWMQIIEDSGNLQIVPKFNIAESTTVIQNALFPASGSGTTFTSTFTATKASSTQVNVNAEGGIAGFGDVFDLIFFEGEASAKYSLWSFDSSLNSVSIAMEFNGVTTVTPSPVSYNISTGTGWFNPAPIQSAVAYNAGVSGYQFTPNPGLNFAAKGNFGMISRLMISQQPTVTLTFETSNYSAFQQIISEQSEWGISFLGIPLAGGSQSYYKATTSQDSKANTVTIVMTPPATVSPVTPTDQLAYVIGAEVLWPGA